jgi:hypothetical protein
MHQTWLVVDDFLRSRHIRREDTSRDRSHAWGEFLLTALLAVMILVTVAAALTWRV